MHVLQCQHHLRRLPQQDAVSLGCSRIAASRKLLTILNDMVRRGQSWQPTLHATAKQKEATMAPSLN